MLGFYPVMLPATIACIVFNAVVSSIPSVFMQNIIAVIENNWQKGDWGAVGVQILRLVSILAVFYILSLAAGFTFNQLMAIMTQGTLKKMREKMFGKMQRLPVKYFDTNDHGDIMSYYTNDIDTLRQMISQSFPHLLISGVTVLTIFGIMVYYCLWLTLVVVLGVAVMTVLIKKVGGGSAKFFIKQQNALGKVEGFVEEMMYGQKVIKVFCHEEESKASFDQINNKLQDVSYKANSYANILMPILGNIGNLLYVLVAIVGCLFFYFRVTNLSVLYGMDILSLGVIVSFLPMIRQFTANVSEVANQINSIALAIGGCSRVCSLLDETPEVDNGYVTLVRAKYDEKHNIVECDEKEQTIWAWKHPHSATHDVTYTLLQGDIRMFNVDFGYVPDKIVLHDVSLYAKPGQKVAFVGATGAGKTTITNLLNRFYDIADGKIRYDGININKIKKGDLRNSLGMVLQDTSLFTGTIMDNIRYYGKLNATDEECIAAAKLANADSFITRLPQGYNTMLTNDGANLSQGQRQLLSIARAAVNNPPVLILDEATSSIDTRTEKIVTEGMDNLMKGRTVFVIAHRLSTIRNSNVIIVLDHGKIIERGTHEDLLDQKGVYYQLYTGAFELE